MYLICVLLFFIIFIFLILFIYLFYWLHWIHCIFSFLILNQSLVFTLFFECIFYYYYNYWKFGTVRTILQSNFCMLIFSQLTLHSTVEFSCNIQTKQDIYQYSLICVHLWPVISLNSIYWKLSNPVCLPKK